MHRLHDPEVTRQLTIAVAIEGAVLLLLVVAVVVLTVYVARSSDTRPDPRKGEPG